MLNLYLNKPQLRALLIDSQIMVLIMGRRLGKSSEIIAHTSAERVFELPRASTMMLGCTYKQVLERTLPATKLGWQKRGYHEGIHYVVGKSPPKSWNKPLYVPSKYEHSISWFNGHIINMASQDREGMVNSLTVWGLYADEAKLLNQKRFEEDALPTVSAPRRYFPNSPHNRFILLCSSMPSLPEGQWLFDFEKQMDGNKCKAILEGAIELEYLRYELFNEKSEGKIRHLKQEISELSKLVNAARNGTTYFAEASTLSNVSILGMDYIYNQRDLLKSKFKSEILNVRPTTTEQAFYANLREEHFYTSFNYEYIDSLNFDLSYINCNQDGDLDVNKPLHIGMDFGANINCIVTCQKEVGIFRVLKNHYVQRPKILDDVIEDWCTYYAPHKNRKLYFWYDNTGNNAQANARLTYAQQARIILVRRGWDVELKTSGGANQEHHKKYLLINTALAGKDMRLPLLKFNEGNCEELKQSMLYAPSIENAKGLISKNKSSERSKVIDQKYATHLSDAFDVVFCGEYKDSIGSIINMDYHDIVIL